MSLDEKRLLPRLRHERWMGWTELPGRDLLTLPIKGLPRVGVGEDTRERFLFVQHTDLEGRRTLAELEAIAVANLARRPEFWNVKETSKRLFGLGTRPSLLEVVSEHAAERILDRAFMAKAHEQLDAPLLAVAMPVRGILWARAAAEGAEASGAFFDQVRRAFENAPRGIEPISPVVFTVKAGAILGVVAGRGADGSALSDADIVPARGFPWPVQGEPVAPDREDAAAAMIPLEDPDDDDRRLHSVGYHAASKTLEYACYVAPGEAIPDSQVRWIAHLVKRGRIGNRWPVDTVRIVCPDLRVATQIASQILPTGAQIAVMGDRGEVRALR